MKRQSSTETPFTHGAKGITETLKTLGIHNFYKMRSLNDDKRILLISSVKD